MAVDIPELLINCAAAFGIGVLWYELTKTLFNLDSEDKGDCISYIYDIDEEEVKEGEGFSDDKRILVIRTLKVQKKN